MYVRISAFWRLCRAQRHWSSWCRTRDRSCPRRRCIRIFWRAALECMGIIGQCNDWMEGRWLATSSFIYNRRIKESQNLWAYYYYEVSCYNKPVGINRHPFEHILNTERSKLSTFLDMVTSFPAEDFYDSDFNLNGGLENMAFCILIGPKVSGFIAQTVSSILNFVRNHGRIDTTLWKPIPEKRAPLK